MSVDVHDAAAPFVWTIAAGRVSSNLVTTRLGARISERESAATGSRSSESARCRSQL